jgi:hypothetical protein
MDAEENQKLKITTPELLQRIRDVIKDTATPSWLNSVPHNFGSAAAGTLKADEWRTMWTVYLPIALVSLWGEGTSHGSADASHKLRDVLDHTMDLASAITLVCMRTMTQARATAYRSYIASWVSGLGRLYPEVDQRTNNHMALHIYDFLLLFGSVRSWWCFPFERLIGQLQRLPNNHKSGESSHIAASYFARRPTPTLFRSTGANDASMLHQSSKTSAMAWKIGLPACSQRMQGAL